MIKTTTEYQLKDVRSGLERAYYKLGDAKREIESAQSEILRLQRVLATIEFKGKEE